MVKKVSISIFMLLVISFTNIFAAEIDFVKSMKEAYDKQAWQDVIKEGNDYYQIYNGNNYIYTYLYMSYAFYKTKNNKDANIYIDKYIAINSLSDKALFIKGLILLDMGDHDSAIKYFEKSNIANADTKNDYHIAICYFRKADMNSKDKKIFNNCLYQALSICENIQGKYDDKKVNKLIKVINSKLGL